MLAYVLALAVFMGSTAIYMVAFFFPEVHRKNDFIWSGVGLFYALVIWIFAHRISGGLLLGHIASVALLYWFGWQTFTLRRQVTPNALQTPVPSTEEVKAIFEQQVSKISLPQRLSSLFSGAKNKAQQVINKNKPQDTTSATASPTQIIEALTKEEFTDATGDVAATNTETQVVEITPPAAVPPNPPSAELVENAQPDSEYKPNIPVEELAPDAALAPTAEEPIEDTPQNPPAS
ncbi:Ycf66 family protein [Calothrix sp. UHCC 0171]|uniref:Ycf66 family protein n=1 Tax=Calothrix sp. UHCC 0171 TaxID=3110245 RepID=UPI002B20A48D|nr:Ycf66 family protein [Calothrix sp. UHCC 0171]MEA5570246.1 Ycf66 family protein [Calothrix sp. UHCC 0171]